MPHFEADAYDDGRCYGLKKSDLTSDKMPPEPDHPPRPEEIKAVASYVIASVKGKGAPNLADCQAFLARHRAFATFLDRIAAMRRPRITI